MQNIQQLFQQQSCLEESFPVFNKVRHDSIKLEKILSRTNSTAQKISSKIRDLDTEAQNIQKTLALLQNFKRLKTEAIEVVEAIKSKLYVNAAEYIQNYLNTPKEILDIYRFKGSHLIGNASPIDYFISAQKQLNVIVSNEFDDAVKSGDKEKMSLNLKLFPKIGAAEVGMDKYMTYLSNLVAKQGQEIKQDPTKVSRLHVKLINDVSEIVAVIIDQQEDLVNGIFGQGNVTVMVNRLKREADNQFNIILTAFTEFHQLSRIIHDIKKSDKTESENMENILLEPRNLDVILGDIAFICQKNKFFEKFIQVKSHQDVLQPDERVKKGIEELITVFITIQEFYIKISVQKALEIDERETSSITSSSVDDVFFIMKNAAKRSLSSFNPILFISTLSSIGFVLDQVYMAFLISKLHNASGMIESKEGRSQFIVFINNLDVCCDNIRTLSSYLDGEATQLRKESEAVSVKLKSALSSLNEEANNFRNASKSWNENLFTQVLRSRLKPLIMQSFGGDIKYILNADEYADMQANQLFLNRFMAGFSKLIGFYKRTLTTFNYNHIFTFIIDHIFKEWENSVLSIRFNLLGATRFDEDLRAVCAYVATMTTLGFRDRFARLSQISTVLNLDSVLEIYEYWGSRKGSLAWKLSGAESSENYSECSYAPATSSSSNIRPNELLLSYSAQESSIAQLNELNDSDSVVFIPIKKTDRRIGYIFHPQLLAAADRLPSNIERSSYTHKLIEAYGLVNCMSIVQPKPASREQMLEFHCREYIDFIMTAEYNQGNESTEYLEKLQEFGLESDCPVFDGLGEYVKWVGGASISAAQALCENTHDVVIAWDGGRHHTGRSHAAGFCYINDIVLAIFQLHNVFQKVLYIDIDIHHGDGVEKAFELSQRVFTLSFHRFDSGFFPGTGTLGDVGFGRGLFHSLNLPLRSGLNGSNFLKIFKKVVETVIKNYSPDAIVMQCGVDGLFGDPLGGKWNLDIKSVGLAVKNVLDYKLPTLLLGGGGYEKALAARCWTYCTAVALEMEDILPTDIPEHIFFPDYGPDFTIFCDAGNQFDRNEIGEYTDNLMEEALNLLGKLNIGTKEKSENHLQAMKKDPS